MINTPFPALGVGDKYLLALTESRSDLLQGMWSSFIFDYIARQKIGGTSLKYFTIRQLPALPPEVLVPHAHFITPRVLELTYTSYDMAPFAFDLSEAGGPYRWDEERRAVIRAELDALFFHLYGIARDDVDYIMETFPIVKRKDAAKHGSYRTKELILDLYDRMAAAGLTLDNPLPDPAGFSSLTPLPGQGPRHPVLEVQQ